MHRVIDGVLMFQIIPQGTGSVSSVSRREVWQRDGRKGTWNVRHDSAACEPVRNLRGHFQILEVRMVVQGIVWRLFGWGFVHLGRGLGETRH